MTIRRSRGIPIAGLAILALVVVSCGPSTLTAAPTSGPTLAPLFSPTAASSPNLTPVPTDPGTTLPPPIPGQTDTEWGRIWDGLPAAFPSWPGSHLTETGAGPASATLDAGSAAAAEVAAFYQSALQRAGYSTVSMSGPREDGGWQLESSGQSGCAIRTTVAPLGSSTIVTILYGAACPLN